MCINSRMCTNRTRDLMKLAKRRTNELVNLLLPGFLGSVLISSSTLLIIKNSNAREHTNGLLQKSGDELSDDSLLLRTMSLEISSLHFRNILGERKNKLLESCSLGSGRIILLQRYSTTRIGKVTVGILAHCKLRKTENG